MPAGGTLKQRAWAHILEANEWFDGEIAFQRNARDSFADAWRANKGSSGEVWTYNGKRETTVRTFPTFQEAWTWVDDQIRNNDAVFGGAVYVTEKRKSTN